MTKHYWKKLRHKWKGILCSWNGRLIKMSILPKATYRFKAICIKIWKTFHRNKEFYNSHENIKDDEQAKQFCNRIKLETLHFLISNTSQSYSNKTVWYWYKYRHIGQGNKEPRNKSTHIWSINIWWGCQECAIGKG